MFLDMQQCHQFIVTAADSNIYSSQLTPPSEKSITKTNIRPIIDLYYYHTPGSYYEKLDNHHTGESCMTAYPHSIRN